MEQRIFAFAEERASIGVAEVVRPSGYQGLYRFHKYWGKKPHELLAYIIEHLTQPGQIVLDPFMGSGTAGRESMLMGRRFIGCDLNPIAVEIARLLAHPPKYNALREATVELEKAIKPAILDSYRLENDQGFATHYLWENGNLLQVWASGKEIARNRAKLDPTDHDRQLSASFNCYRSRFIRQPTFFTNSRINARTEMSLDDLLTGRAQRNLDLLLNAINEFPPNTRSALRLCLTGASGQMSKMVFAVTGRGKTMGLASKKVEVGSWVIGFWRPRRHFEVNVWNCFRIRATALLRSLKKTDPLSESRLGASAPEVLFGKADATVSCQDYATQLAQIPDGAVHLVITDPPHSDRIPYLELSELWNSILGEKPAFEREVVISNAKERHKSPTAYRECLSEFLTQVSRVLSPTGILVTFFNARQSEHWEALRLAKTSVSETLRSRLRFLGSFPCNYSAGSVVQDNRSGSLKGDFALVFARADAPGEMTRRLGSLRGIPNWSPEFPGNFCGGGVA